MTAPKVPTRVEQSMHPDPDEVNGSQENVFISISLSPRLLLPPKSFSLLSSHSHSHPNLVRLPNLSSSSHSHLSLTLTSSLSPPKPLTKKSTTLSPPIPLQFPFSPSPRRPTSDPSTSAAGIHGVSIVWFRNDLRVHDHECLTTANNHSLSVLPVYCFDPNDYTKSASGFGRAGPTRAIFLVNFISDLRKNLQGRGSDLVVRVGKPEVILVELAKQCGANALYAHREVSGEEAKLEYTVEAAMKQHGVEVNYLWGSSTLYHVDDLPFQIEDVPTDYDAFLKEVISLEIRKILEPVHQFRGLPDVEPGEIPSLMDLMPQDGMAAANASLMGGETEAMHWLAELATECQAHPHKKGNNDSKISPWLAMGCLSPRSMLDELETYASRAFSASSGAVNWWRRELVWVDFFRFITKKYSSANQYNTSPVTACTGATGFITKKYSSANQYNTSPVTACTGATG